jgi:mannan endo-1,4-beta-mannosidase
MFKSKTLLLSLLTIMSLNIFFSCKKDELPMPNNSSQKYTISGSKILSNTQPIQLIGANAFHVFSAGSTDMNSWNIDISREFIGNIKETQLQGNPIKDSNGAYLYSLQNIIDDNRLNNRITIICAFGWDGKNETEFTGKSPTQTTWWNDYKIKLKSWAMYFKDQPDVWIEVWNEPYRYDRADGYTDLVWINDMNKMVGIIRNTGNQNIILVPCAEQGQDESVLINKGNEFLTDKSNIIYDIHAYEKWLLDNNSSINNRLEQLKLKNIPILFGETAPLNAGILMNPNSFLNIIYNRGLSVCAWVWKKDENDKDALLTATGSPNDNNNNNWGTTYKNLTSKVRNQ